MSEKWLRDAQDNFKEALEMESVELAKAVLMDVMEEGYRDEAEEMYHQLQSSPIAQHLVIGDDEIL